MADRWRWNVGLPFRDLGAGIDDMDRLPGLDRPGEVQAQRQVRDFAVPRAEEGPRRIFRVDEMQIPAEFPFLGSEESENSARSPVK